MQKLVSNDGKTFCGICWQHKPTVNMNSYMPPSQMNSQMNSAGGTAGSYRWFIFAFSQKCWVKSRPFGSGVLAHHPWQHGPSENISTKHSFSIKPISNVHCHILLL